MKKKDCVLQWIMRYCFELVFVSKKYICKMICSTCIILATLIVYLPCFASSDLSQKISETDKTYRMLVVNHLTQYYDLSDFSPADDKDFSCRINNYGNIQVSWKFRNPNLITRIDFEFGKEDDSILYYSYVDIQRMICYTNCDPNSNKLSKEAATTIAMQWIKQNYHFDPGELLLSQCYLEGRDTSGLKWIFCFENSMNFIYVDVADSTGEVLWGQWFSMPWIEKKENGSPIFHEKEMLCEDLFPERQAIQYTAMLDGVNAGVVDVYPYQNELQEGIVVPLTQVVGIIGGRVWELNHDTYLIDDSTYYWDTRHEDIQEYGHYNNSGILKSNCPNAVFYYLDKPYIDEQSLIELVYVISNRHLALIPPHT